MSLDEQISAIESCDAQPELNAALQSIVENAGFHSYCFLDTGALHVDVPFFTGTTGESWESEYETNNFIHVDACISRARRTNRPFTWGAVELPERLGKRKPGAHRTMDAAQDHGFTDGFVIPFHFADERGLVHSSVCTLFWKDKPKDFHKRLAADARYFHLILLYWAQRSIEIRRPPIREAADNVVALDDWTMANKLPSLTDRERDVLAWAARGKTAAETADILTISNETVITHLKHCIRKLNAGNKTHAVAKAVHLSLVDI